MITVVWPHSKKKKKVFLGWQTFCDYITSNGFEYPCLDDMKIIRKANRNADTLYVERNPYAEEIHDSRVLMIATSESELMERFYAALEDI